MLIVYFNFGSGSAKIYSIYKVVSVTISFYYIRSCNEVLRAIPFTKKSNYWLYS